MGKSCPHPVADHRAPATPPPDEPTVRADCSGWNADAMKPDESTSGGPFGVVDGRVPAEDSQTRRSQARAGDKHAAPLSHGEGRRGPVWESRRRPR
jgi:hypothetical protein